MAHGVWIYHHLDLAPLPDGVGILCLFAKFTPRSSGEGWRRRMRRLDIGDEEKKTVKNTLN